MTRRGGARQRRGATPAASCCRPPPTCTRRRRSRSAGRRRSKFIQRAQAQRVRAGRQRRRSASSCRAACTTACIRALQRLGLADVCGETAGAALRAERHLSAGRRRGRRVLPQARTRCWWSRRASPTTSSRRSPRCCARPASRHQARRQGPVADGRRIHRPGACCDGIGAFLRADAIRDMLAAERARARTRRRRLDDEHARSARRASCRRGRRASASAARSGRSSPP